MAEQFLHGVEVSEISSGPRTIRTTKSSIIGLIGTAPDADNTVFPLNKPVLIVGSRREAAKLGATGTLPMAINGIFDQIGAMVIVIRVEAGEDEAETIANIIGGIDAPAEGVKIYNKPEGPAGTGVYFVNSSTTQDEMVSKKKSILFSMIF